MGWAQLKRDGDLVPIDELEAAARWHLSQPTKSGRLPWGLGYIDKQMLALAREPWREPPAASPEPVRRGPNGRARHVISPEDEAAMNAWMERGLARTQGIPPQ